ncbi:MAG: hypothetical protein ACLUO8_13425 [Christensenellales bacterium]
MKFIGKLLDNCNIEKGNLQRLWNIFLKKGTARARCQESAKKAVLEQGRFDFDGPRWYNEDRFAAMRTGKEKQQKGWNRLGYRADSG